MAYGISPPISGIIALLITTYYAVTWETQKIHEHPVFSSIGVFFIAGFGVHLCRRLLDRYGTQTAQYLPIADSDDGELSDALQDSDVATSYGHYESLSGPGIRRRRQLFLVLVSSVTLRVAVFVLVDQNSQCTVSGLEVALLPALLFSYDFAFFQKTWKCELEENTSMSNNAFEDIYSMLCYVQSRYFLPTALFSFGVFITTSFPHLSTYICPRQEGYTVILQLLGTILDTAIIIAVYHLQVDDHKEQRKPNIFSAVFLSSASIVAIVSFISFANTTSFNTMLQSSSGNLWSVGLAGIALTMVLVCLECLIQEVRPLNLVTIFLFCGTFARLVTQSRASRDIFPPHSKMAKMVGLACVYFGFLLGMSFYKNTEIKNNFVRRYVPQWFYILVGIGFVISEFLYISAPRYVGFSPINYLMYEARISAEQWLKDASASNSLKSAVKSYEARYQRAPPPNFDTWFQYAMDRDAYVIDDYDEVEKNLLPFWSINPAELRRLSTIQNIDSDIVGIRIRNSQVDVSNQAHPDIWVSDAAAMIRNFSQWLPDMNIGLNTRDMPRVAVPWTTIKLLNGEGQQASQRALNAHQTFSEALNPPWDEDDATLNNEMPMADSAQFKSAYVFNDIFVPTCPHKSSVRNGQVWDHGTFCARCARPHTIGPFIQNWTIAGDLCHQPDIFSLHSYFSSSSGAPAQRRFYQSLVPIFSRRSIPGFNDILFPGPGTYLDSRFPSQDADSSLSNDLMWYNDTISFNDKQNMLFWRGKLDDLDIYGDEWKGMQSQRLVHRINHSKRPITVLLPSPKRLTYKEIAASEIHSLINTNVSFTHPTDCIGSCPAQVSEFGTIEDANIPEWWSNRYLLSIDQNVTTSPPSSKSPTSPTFLQMLASNSLPFHASIFRTWYSPRIIPWLHFIPLDIRFQGVWASLVYFTGLGPVDENGQFGPVKLGGKEVTVEGKVDQAHFIANTGRDWVERTVRREDAQVYMFRLLLEWGRLVDDRREELGFSLPEEG